MKSLFVRLALVAFCVAAAVVFGLGGLELRANASDFDAEAQVYALGTMMYLMACVMVLAGMCAAIAPAKA